MVELPVTMSGSKPLVTAKINGAEAQFVADSGTFYSMISAASAAQFQLKQRPAPYGLRIQSFGGDTQPTLVTVKLFTLAGLTIPSVDFLVGGGEAGAGSIGVLGQNVFRIGDVEYDLARGVIRLMHPEDCRRSLLAYWVAADQAYSVMDIEPTSPRAPVTTGTAFVNGTKIRVIFDTGAGASMLSLKAAERAGINPDAPGVVDGGYARGIGPAMVKSYVAPFASFKIGDEEIRNTRLRIADLDLEFADMLIGADFFLSHRIYVATSQRKLYFTYNGGPVFNLSNSAFAQQPRAAADPDDPTDAAAFSRRGAAAAGRHDYDHALADLSRACELEPGNPDYRYQRAMVYWETKQNGAAMADLDQALKLKPDDLAALVARAQLRTMSKDLAGTRQDLDAADGIAAKEADSRLSLARSYQNIDQLPASIAQYDLWISYHPADARLADALNGRCTARALLGLDLPKALADCNAALRSSAKASPLSAHIMRNRGLVRLRLGDYDKSIADFDDSLKLSPRDAWALYGRGVDKLRKGKTADGQADMAAAAALAPQIADSFGRRGIVP